MADKVIDAIVNLVELGIYSPEMAVRMAVQRVDNQQVVARNAQLALTNAYDNYLKNQFVALESVLCEAETELQRRSEVLSVVIGKYPEATMKVRSERDLASGMVKRGKK